MSRKEQLVPELQEEFYEQEDPRPLSLLGRALAWITQRQSSESADGIEIDADFVPPSAFEEQIRIQSELETVRSRRGRQRLQDELARCMMGDTL